MQEKKGISTTTLVLTVISLSIAILVLKGCVDYLYAGVLNEDDIGDFDKLVDELEKLPSGKSVGTVIKLNSGNAIIGINKGADAFKCHGCHQDIYSPETLVYEFPRNKASGCGSDSCICRCAGIEQKPIVGFERYELTCSSISCRKVNFELLQRVSLEEIFKEEEITKSEYPYWENGFFYVRAKSKHFKEAIFNGAGQFANYKDEIFAYLEKEGNVIAICPTTASYKSLRCLN